MTIKDGILAAVPPLLWAITYALAKPGLEHFPPLLFTAMVYAVAALMLWRPRQRRQTSLGVTIVVAAFAGAVQSGLVFAGLAGLPASLAAVVVQLQVPFAVLAAVAICGERLNLRRTLGIVIALFGIFVAAGATPADVRAYPLILIIAGTASWGLGQAVIRRFVRDDGRTIIAGIVSYSAPMLTGLSALLERGQLTSIATAGITHWTSVVVLAVGGFVLAYSIWYGLLNRHRVDQVAPFALLMPPFGIAAGWLLLDDVIGKGEIVGAAIVVAGLWLVVRTPERHQAPLKTLP